MSYSLTLQQVYVLNAIEGNPQYGLEIIRYLEEEHNINIILGSLYNILAKLERDGLVESYFGESTPERGGRRRKYYKITGIGERTLNQIRQEVASSFNLQEA